MKERRKKESKRSPGPAAARRARERRTTDDSVSSAGLRWLLWPFSRAQTNEHQSLGFFRPCAQRLESTPSIHRASQSRNARERRGNYRQGIDASGLVSRLHRLQLLRPLLTKAESKKREQQFLPLLLLACISNSPRKVKIKALIDASVDLKRHRWQRNQKRSVSSLPLCASSGESKAQARSRSPSFVRSLIKSVDAQGLTRTIKRPFFFIV